MHEAEINSALGLSLRLVPDVTVEEWAMRLWQEVRAGISGNGYGPGKITWGDLANYERFTGVQLSEFRVRLLLLIDDAFRRHYRPESAPQQER